MKTSELIKQLTEIDATVPFDADIVTGDDWLPQHVTKVYHNPPHTYLEFESYAANEWSEDAQEENRLASINELAIRAHMIEQMIDMIEGFPAYSREDVIREMVGLSAKMQAMLEALKK